MSNAYYASLVVKQAIRDGDLPRLPRVGHSTIKCMDCGAPASCWDHRDYLKPMEVDPVCASCNCRRGAAKNHNGYKKRVTTTAEDAVDFQALIKNIRASGRTHTLEWIAEQCDVGYTTIHMLKNTPGRQPRYELGKKLVELEAECCE